MAEKKHLAEWTMDFIDISRLARASAEKIGDKDKYDFILAIDMESESLEIYMRRAWERLHRLKVISDRLSVGKDGKHG